MNKNQTETAPAEMWTSADKHMKHLEARAEAAEQRCERLEEDIKAWQKIAAQTGEARKAAERLLAALQWVKEVTSERKGTAMWAQMVEDKARAAITAEQEAK
jgi:hypothetical protein